MARSSLPTLARPHKSTVTGLATAFGLGRRGPADDETSMHATSSIGAGSGLHGWPAVGAGLRAEFESTIMRQALGSAGLLSPDLAAGLDALGEAGRLVTEAGLTAIRHDLIGTLIDELA